MLTSKITDYQILKYIHRDHLERKVSMCIKEGWQPLGGVAVCLYVTSGNYREYYQAIVKYEQQNPTQSKDYYATSF